MATATVAELRDLEAKVQRAMEFRGARYIHILVPCPLGWGSASHDTIRIARLYDGGELRPGLLGRLARLLLHRRSAAFDFTMLGVRVPALIVSPFVPAGAVDATVRDHASVPATLRALFAPQAPPLSARDRWAPPVLSLLSLDEPRTDLPDLSAWVSREPVTPQITLPVPGQPEPPVPGYYRDLVELADMVDQRLPGPTAPPTLGPRARARHVTEEFEDHAEQTRGR